MNFYLRHLLARAGIPDSYLSHSFRIGTATRQQLPVSPITLFRPLVDGPALPICNIFVSPHILLPMRPRGCDGLEITSGKVPMETLLQPVTSLEAASRGGSIG